MPSPRPRSDPTSPAPAPAGSRPPATRRPAHPIQEPQPWALRCPYERTDTRRNLELGRPWLRRGVVPAGHGGARPAAVVRGALRDGGGQLELLPPPGAEHRRALVGGHARGLRLRLQAAQGAVAALGGAPVAAAGPSRRRRDHAA